MTQSEARFGCCCLVARVDPPLLVSRLRNGRPRGAEIELWEPTLGGEATQPARNAFHLASQALLSAPPLAGRAWLAGWLGWDFSSKENALAAWRAFERRPRASLLCLSAVVLAAADAHTEHYPARVWRLEATRGQKRRETNSRSSFQFFTAAELEVIGSITIQQLFQNAPESRRRRCFCAQLFLCTLYAIDI